MNETTIFNEVRAALQQSPEFMARYGDLLEVDENNKIIHFKDEQCEINLVVRLVWCGSEYKI